MSANTYWNEQHFPNSSEYTCPPENANTYIGQLFRFAQKDNEVSFEDYELASSRSNFRSRNKNKPEFLCQGSGLSSYKDETAATVAYEKISSNSRAFKRKFKGIYKIILVESDGVVAPTPSRNSRQHCTWWASKSKEALLSRSMFVKKI